MATSAATLIERLRLFLGDWPDLDTITASLTSTATTATVADTTIYAKNWLVEIDTELLLITSLASGTTLSVRRGVRGSTAATHASAAGVLINPRWSSRQMLEALNVAIHATWPYLYLPVVDESITIATDTYEYTIPDMPSDSGQQIGRIGEVWIKVNGEVTFSPLKTGWRVLPGATQKIRFAAQMPVGATVRLVGWGPFAPLASTASSLDADFPRHAEPVLLTMAADHLLMGSEAGRVRHDVGLIDGREQANRVGSAMSAANGLRTRFERQLMAAALPPLAPHLEPWAG